MWFHFLVSAILVILGGIKLTKYADIVSDQFRINKTWAGMILLGAVTSFPEFAASFSAAVFINAPNLAVANISGSININLMVIVLMDFLYRKGSVTSQASDIKTYELSSLFFGLLALIVVADIFLAGHFKTFALGSLSYASILIMGIYGLGAKIIFESTNHEIHLVDPSDQEQQDRSKALLKLVISALVVVAGGLWLSRSCNEIAMRTLFGQTFVGVFFMGFVTSLPEIVVSLAALK